MKKLFLVMALCFLSVSIYAIPGDGTGSATVRPNSVAMAQANVSFTITVNATGTTAYNSNGKIYVSRPAGFTDFSLSYNGDGGVTITAVNGSIATWVTDGKTLTITTNSLTAVTGKVVIGWNLVDCPATGGNYKVAIKTAPQGGAGGSISSFPNIAVSINTPTATKTNTPAYSQTNTPVETSTKTVTKTRTPTPTNTHIFTATATKTNTPVNTPTATKTITQTHTVLPTSTNTPVCSPTATPTFTPQQTAIPVSIGAVVKSKFMEAQEKGLLYNWTDEIATAGLDTVKQYEMFMASFDSYSFKMTASYSGNVIVRIYRIDAADSAGGTTITATNSNDDIAYTGLVSNTGVFADGEYNTDPATATCIYSVLIGGGNTKEIYCPKALGGGVHYVFSVETKETDNEGSLFVEFYGN